jgi:hypothetical protein
LNFLLIMLVIATGCETLHYIYRKEEKQEPTQVENAAPGSGTPTISSVFALLAASGSQYLDSLGENIDSDRGCADHLPINLDRLRRIGLNADLSGLPVIEEIIAGAD